MPTHANLRRTVSVAILIGAFLLTGCGMSDILLAQSTDAIPEVTSPIAAERPQAENEASTNDAEIPADPTAKTGTLAALQSTLADIYTQVNPSIVSVQVSKQPVQGLRPGSGNPNRPGVGSGFVWDRSGHIVTNHHVVDQADEIRVRFHDGFIAEAVVVGSDPDSDLAVIRVDVETEHLTPVSVVDSDTLKVGALAVALGSPFGLENTMTVGFVSAVGRSLPANASQYTIPRIIQTDAAINPGNSGGALVNDRGEVIGVNTAIISPSQASAGIGFAIPSSLVIEIVPVLIEEGEYVHSWLGIRGTTLTNTMADELGLEATQQGILINEVISDGPADRAGLRGARRELESDGSQIPVGGDVIVSIEGKAIDDFEDLVSELVGYPAGETVDLGIVRDDERITIPVILGERPEETVPQEQAQREPQPRERASAWMGIAARDVTESIADRMGLDRDQRGVLIEAVAPNSPAAAAGLEGGTQRVMIDGSIVVLGGDIIVGWNDASIPTFEELRQILLDAEPGEVAAIDVLRDEEMRTVQITLGER